MLTYSENSENHVEGLPGNEDEVGNTVADLEARVAYLERIIKVSQVVNSTLELGPLLQVISNVGIELAGSEGCSILLYDSKSKCLRFMPSTFSTDEKIVVPIEGSIAGIIFQKAKPILIRDVQNDPRWNSQVDQASDFITHSILGVPLKIKNEVIGVLELVNKVGDKDFGHEDIQIATALAAQAAIAIENARLLEQVQQAYDELAELDRLKSEFVSI
ncbi:MAG: GAF domain-containing protein, partial [Chloroflexota bacterium]